MYFCLQPKHMKKSIKYVVVIYIFQYFPGNTSISRRSWIYEYFPLLCQPLDVYIPLHWYICIYCYTPWYVFLLFTPSTFGTKIWRILLTRQRNLRYTIRVYDPLLFFADLVTGWSGADRTLLASEDARETDCAFAEIWFWVFWLCTCTFIINNHRKPRTIYN